MAATRQWYPCLKADKMQRGSRRGLLDRYGEETLVNKIVVAIETTNGKRNYTVFRNPRDLYDCIQATPKIDRRMHEVCLGFGPQKPRFDIDVKREELKPPYDTWDFDALGNRLKDLVIEGAFSVLIRDGIKPDIEKNVVVCASHGVNKISYHIILHGFVHGNHKEAGAFHSEVLTVIRGLLKPEEQKFDLGHWIDSSIYSRNHALRLVNNHKLNETRIKYFMDSFTYKDQIHIHDLDVDIVDERHAAITTFSHTLISFTPGCTVLPMYASSKVKYEHEFDTTLLPDDLIDQVDQYLSARFGDGVFTVADVRGSLICLTRHAPTYCDVCERTHDHVHPFIFISPGGFFKFNCRQSLVEKRDNPHITLGQIRGLKADLFTYTRTYAEAVDAVKRFRATNRKTNYLVDIDWSKPTCRTLHLTQSPKQDHNDSSDDSEDEEGLFVHRRVSVPKFRGSTPQPSPTWVDLEFIDTAPTEIPQGQVLKPSSAIKHPEDHKIKTNLQCIDSIQRQLRKNKTTQFIQEVIQPHSQRQSCPPACGPLYREPTVVTEENGVKIIHDYDNRRSASRCYRR